MTMRTARFEVFQGRDRQWYFALRSANNWIIVQGEGYSTERDAYRGADTVRQTILETPNIRFVRRK